MEMTLVMKTMFFCLILYFRYGQYYFDDGTQAPYRIEATDQNPDYESSTS